MEKNKHCRNFCSLVSQHIRILSTVAFDQSMSCHFAQVVSQLVNGIVGQFKGMHYRFINHFRCPAVKTNSGMHYCFHQADHSGVMNFYTGNAGVFACDRQRKSLEKWKVEMDIQGIRLRACKAIKDLFRGITKSLKVLNGLFYAKVINVVAAYFHPQESVKQGDAVNYLT